MIWCALAVLVLAGSGVLALVVRAPWLPALAAVAAAALGLPPAFDVLWGAQGATLELPWLQPLGTVHLALDALSAFFVVPVLVLGALCACHGAAQRIPGAAYNVLLAAMLAVLLARDGLALLIAWEAMTLASFLLVTREHAHDEVRRAGWIYLVAGHLGFACLIALVVVLSNATGSVVLAPRVLDGASGAIALVLAILGFGVKAGAVPMHVWLPEAHAVAPSHVSALMSGGMIKLGLYGILRTLTLVAPMPWAGPVLAGLGVISAVAGIALALYQRDLKRTLAYSSIENVGVMLLGLGLGLSGLATEHPAIAVFGLYGGLLHVWVHAVVKGALFLGAGNVVHASGTRDVEQLGGLLARMPRTGLVLIVGGVAIAALPPLAGFASEWLIYLGLIDGGMHGSGSGLVMLLGVTVLAGVGVLAALCFVRALGLALLGQPRSAGAASAHEVGTGELVPMVLLCIATVALPFAAPLLVSALAPVAEQLAGAPVPVERAAAALATIAWMSATVWAAIALGAAAFAYCLRRSTNQDTWGCGYAAPTPRMQYTSGSFSEAVQKLLPRRLRARVAIQRDPALFPEPGRLTSDRRDPFTREGYEPGLDRLVRRLARLRWVQQGILHTYLLLIVAAVIVLVAAVSVHDWWSR